MNAMIENGKKILRKLNDSGYEAYFVGGFVRDRFLGIESTDIDITTNALPDEIEALFTKTIPTGKKYGTITVIIDNQSFELTTYRLDQNYQNNRKPEAVRFTRSLEEDLVRRDFTMNALVQNLKGEIQDFFKGKNDIENRIIKAIDDPYRRFEEDALRILRAIRFVGKLNFFIEEKTFAAMKEKASLLRQISSERIISELTMILKQEHLLPVYKVINDISLGDVFPEMKEVILKLYGSKKSLSLEEFFAMTLQYHEEEELSKWRLSNKSFYKIKTINTLMNILMNEEIRPEIAFKYPETLMLKANDIIVAFYKCKSQKTKINDIYKSLLIKSNKDLKISGRDISPLVEDKKMIGILIEELIHAVLNKKVINEKVQLLKYAKTITEAIHESNI